MWAESPPGEVCKRTLHQDDISGFESLYATEGQASVCDFTPLGGRSLVCAPESESGCACTSGTTGPGPIIFFFSFAGGFCFYVARFFRSSGGLSLATWNSLRSSGGLALPLGTAFGAGFVPAALAFRSGAGFGVALYYSQFLGGVKSAVLVVQHHAPE